MTGPSLDLDALREKAEMIREACPCCNPFSDEDGNDAAADQILAVLALVDEQQERIRLLEEYVDANEAASRELFFDDALYLRFRDARRALGLAGSPTEKETTDA